MGKLPTVTIGRATADRSPQATAGQATGQAVTPINIRRITPPNVKQLTLNQASEITSQLLAPLLVIEELTGTKREIKLSERALPYRGLKFEAQMRMDEGEYTGYPRVNQTILGGRESDTELSGMWKDRFLGDRSSGQVRLQVGGPTGSASLEEFVPDGVLVEADSGLSRKSLLLSARDLCDLFEDVVYRGRTLRLKWLHLRRIGRLERFSQNWLNPHDVEWKMNFKWISRDEKVAFPSPSTATLVGLSYAFHSAYVDMHSATNFDGIDDLAPEFADRVDAGVGRVQRAVRDVNDAVETRVAAVTDPVDAIRRATTIATFVRDECADLIETIDGSVSSSILVSPTAFVPGQPPTLDSFTNTDPGKQLTAACQQRRAVRYARRMRHVAARQRFAALRQLDSNSIGSAILRDQQDLRDLSREFYGTPDAAEQIRAYNGLDTYSPPAGTLVFIPTGANT